MPFTLIRPLFRTISRSTGFLYMGMFSFRIPMLRLCLEMQYTGVPNPGFFWNSEVGKLIVAVSPSEMKDLRLPEESSMRVRLKDTMWLPETTLSPSLMATGFEKRTTAFEPRTLSMVPTVTPLCPGSSVLTIGEQPVLPFVPVLKK